MVATEKIGAVLQEAINSYAKTIEEHGESFRSKSTALVTEINGYNEQSKNLYQKIQATDTLIEQYNIELFGGSCQWPTELSHYWPLILSHFPREKSLIQF